MTDIEIRVLLRDSRTDSGVLPSHEDVTNMVVFEFGMRGLHVRSEDVTIRSVRQDHEESRILHLPHATFGADGRVEAKLTAQGDIQLGVSGVEVRPSESEDVVDETYEARMREEVSSLKPIAEDEDPTVPVTDDTQLRLQAMDFAVRMAPEPQADLTRLAELVLEFLKGSSPTLQEAPESVERRIKREAYQEVVDFFIAERWTGSAMMLRARFLSDAEGGEG